MKNVRDLMTPAALTCTREDSLHAVAEAMWESDCGCLPVVDPNGHVLGMLTDRDICLTAFVDGRPLREIPVSVPLRDDPVSDEVWSCHPEDTLESVGALMREYKVRRLPVVGDDGRLVGILSLSDLAREAMRSEGAITRAEVGRILAAICAPDPGGEARVGEIPTVT